MEKIIKLGIRIALEIWENADDDFKFDSLEREETTLSIISKI